MLNPENEIALRVTCFRLALKVMRLAPKEEPITTKAILDAAKWIRRYVTGEAGADDAG